MVQSWAEIDSEQRMLLTMKVWGLERVADVATVAEVHSPAPFAMIAYERLLARRPTVEPFPMVINRGRDLLGSRYRRSPVSQTQSMSSSTLTRGAMQLVGVWNGVS